MAVKKTINIDINNNAEETAKDFDTLNKSINQTTKSTKNLDATFEEVYGELQPLTTRMGEAEDRLYELSLAGDTTSKEFQELLTKVGQYRKVQIQTDIAVDGAAKTMTQKLGSALTGATSGFALAQGSMALFGSENEALEKSLLKVQGAMAIQQGVQGLSDSYKELQIGTKLAAVAQYAYTTAVGTSSGAMKVFRLALISTGIGALIVGLGLLIANFDKVKKAVNDASKKFDKLGTTLKIVLFPITAIIEGFKLMQKGLQAFGLVESEAEKKRTANAEAQKKRHDERIAQIKEEIKEIENTIAVEQRKNSVLNQIYELRKKNAKDTNELNSIEQQQRAANLKLVDDEQEVFVNKLKLTNKRYREEQAKQLIIINQMRAKGQKVSQGVLDRRAEKYAVILENERNLESGNLLAFQKFNIKRENINNAFTDNVETNNQKKIDSWKTYRDERLSIARQIEDLQNSLLEDGIEKELEINRVKFRILREDAKGNADEKIELRALYTRQEEQAEDEIRNKFRQESLDKEIQFFEDNKLPLMEAQADKEVEVEFNKYAELGKIQKAAFDKEKKERKIKNEFALQSTVDGLNVISNVAALFAGKSEKAAKRAFQVQKAVSIAQATIDTYKSANAIFASTAANPITILNPSAPFIAAGIAVAAGLANVATIGSQKFQGGGGDGGGGQESAPDLSGGAPSFNVVGDSGINQLASLQQQPVQAFVVSGEVTTSQALDRNRVENATL